jgi:signal transduction histidine kinase
VARAAEAAGRAAGIEATCAAEGAVRPLPTTTEVVLLRVGQEALANVRRHAAATRVDVQLRYHAAAVELSVADNGRGFVPALAGTSSPGIAVGASSPSSPDVPAGRSSPPAAAGPSSPGAAVGAAGPGGPTGGGFGLRGMRERVRQAGGTLTVVSAPGAGTTVRAEVPR